MSVPPDSEKPAPAAIMAEQEALPTGTRLGELEIVRVLGVGGFGIVYLARDHSLEREVALKEYMPAALATRGQGPQITVRSGALAETYAVGLRSFINEARLLAKFDHPSLVKVYRFWEDNATAYMVMPYLQGRTLRDARRSMTHAPDEAWVRGVVVPIMGALEALHREGVYHRDIAPDNILLPLEGPPVLLDFGAARRIISDRTQSLTAILKPSYAPLEQYADMTTMRQGPWTDIYALGAVVHFLLQGAPPTPATARALQDEMVPLWMRNYPGVTPRFLAAIDWALAVRPQERPQNIDALRAVLDGRSEPPMLARTVPGSTALMPVHGAAVTTGYEPTQHATATPATPTQADAAFQPTRQLAPRDVPTATAPPASDPAPAAAAASARPAPAASAASPASKKGLVVAGLLLVAGLGAAAAWQAVGPRENDAPQAAASAPAPEPVPRPPVAVAPAPPLVAPAVAATEPAASAPAEASEAVEPPVAAAPLPRTRPAGETVAAAPLHAAGRPVPRVGDGNPAGDESGVEHAGGRPVALISNAMSTEHRGEARQRTLREAIVATRQQQAQQQPHLQAAPQGAVTAREACGGRVLLALWSCLQRECRKPRYAQQGECLKINEERRAREFQ